ncbi:MAG: carboxymuconolactone decarboxylase family protein [Alphaproteobacteria bacterium]
MARVPGLTAEDVPEEHRDEFNRLRDIFAAFSNQVPVYAHSPVGMKHIFGMSLALRETGNLPRRLIEIAVVAASHANRCAYCVAHHSTILVELGLEADSVSALETGDSPGLSEEERLVRDYAVCVTERAWGIRDAMFEQLRRHFSDTQIVELTMRIALTGMFNKVNQALGIAMEEDLMADFMACGLAEDSLPAAEPAPE